MTALREGWFDWRSSMFMRGRFLLGLLFCARLGAFAGSLAGLSDALIGDLHGVRHFLCGGSGERAIQARDVDAAIPHLGVDSSVHRGEEFVAKLVEDAVYVEVRHTLTIPELCHDRLTESRNR